MPSRHSIGPWSAADQPENLLAANLDRSNIRRCGFRRGTPFQGRERELGRLHDELDAVIQLQMVVTAPSPAEVAAAVGDRAPVDVIDMCLVPGGCPRLVSAAAEHPDAARFVHTQLSDDTLPLLVTGQRILSSEFRDAESVRAVLESIGSVEVGYATFSSAVGLLRGDEKVAGAAGARALVPGAQGARWWSAPPERMRTPVSTVWSSPPTSWMRSPENPARRQAGRSDT